jgi:hypothetical protein
VIALFVQFGVVDALCLAVSFRRYDDFRPALGDPVAQMISVVTLVGQKSLGFDPFDKFVRQGDVVTLARSRDQSDGKTESFCRGMNFRAQSAARPAKTLGISPPFSLRAPAAC